MQLDPVAIPNLPNAITIFGNFPDTEMRIGVVKDISDEIVNVSISGADVLTPAPYLFGQYRPNIGDNVVCMRMDNQWVVVGALSGYQSNNQVFNSSFEDDTAAPPGGWTLYHDPASTEAADVSAVELPIGWPIDGPQAVRFRLDATPPGSSIDFLSSGAIQVQPGQQWTASAWLVGESLGSGPCVRAQAQLLVTFHTTGTDSYPTVVSQQVLATAVVPTTLPWIHMRSAGLGVGAVTVPPTAGFMRVVLLVSAQHDSCTTNFAFNIYWDRVIATRVS